MKRPAWWYDEPDEACRCEELPCWCAEIKAETREAEADVRIADREMSERAA